MLVLVLIVRIYSVIILLTHLPETVGGSAAPATTRCLIQKRRSAVQKTELQDVALVSHVPVLAPAAAVVLSLASVNAPESDITFAPAPALGKVLTTTPTVNSDVVLSPAPAPYEVPAPAPYNPSTNITATRFNSSNNTFASTSTSISTTSATPTSGSTSVSTTETTMKSRSQQLVGLPAWFLIALAIPH
eukprot:gnl/MRDRNA2_/MRDRNA2_91325_c0_seq1.p1 gnl/MRDRNA2_/MRDRNA2_91325_c0~~gnl/MRDRNA2_/MRDRNA2_91325_c0_seq1.p1  ORF type:complete len:189 (+),score=9.47 gnl/MRDRNA2_/MRDRNA2_91325_c0_seq1:81-647(+)